MDPVSLAAAIFALARTAAVVTDAIYTAYSSNVSSAIDNLSNEFKHTSDAVERLREFAQEPHRFEGKEGLCRQASEVVADTHQTLTELRERINRLQPPDKAKGKWRTLQARTRYQWSEGSIQTLLLRLQARRSALSSVFDSFARAEASAIKADTETIRTATVDIKAETTLLRAQVDQINAQLQEALTKLRETGLPPVAEAPNLASVPAPSSVQATGRDTDAISVADSAIDISTPGHSRSPSSTTKPTAAISPPLIHGNIPTLLRASSGHEVQLAHKRYTSTKAAAVARSFTEEQDRTLRSLARSLSAAEAAPKGLTSLNIAKAALALAKAYRDAGLYENALQYYHDALTTREANLGVNHPSTLTIWDSIAQVHEIRSQWSFAVSCYQASLEGRLQDPKIGPGHPSTLTATTKVARMQHQLGQYDEAARNYISVLSVYESQRKSQSLPALAVRLQLAETHQSQKKPEEALAAFVAVRDQARLVRGGESIVQQAERAMETLQDIGPTPTPEPLDDEMINTCRQQLEELSAALGRAHPETLAKMHELAMAYASDQQHRNAVGWFQEVITGRTKVFGSDHPLTLDATYQLASSFEELGDLDNALEKYHIALIGRETKLGDDHPQTLSSVVSTSSIYSARGDNNVARDLLLRAVDGYTRRFGVDHSNTLSAKYKLAEVYREKALLQQALELHQEVLDRRVANLGLSNSMTLNSERALGNVYHRMKQHDMAVTHLQRALEGRMKTFGRVHTLTTTSALDLASLYWDTERPADAVGYYHEALLGIQNQQPDSQIAGVVTMSNIALCYYALKDYAQAITWYKKVLVIQESEYGPSHKDTIETVERLARCSMETEDWSTAVELFQRVVAYKEKSSPNNPMDWSFNLFQLALAYFKKGMFEDSLTWSRRILALGSKIRPEERLATMRRMGLIYSRQAKLEEALETYQTTLDECKTTLGDNHWLEKGILSEMSDLYLQMDHQTRTAHNYQNTLNKLQESLDRDDFHSVQILYRFADVHLEQHRYQEALNLYTAVLGAVEHSSLKHETHFRNLGNACISDIATCHMKLFNNVLALSFLDRLLYCGDDEYRLGALVRIGNTQETQGDYMPAIDTFKQLLEIETAKVGGARRRDALMSVRKIAALYSRASKYQDALAWANQALQGFQALGADAQVEVYETLDFLSVVYCHLTRFQDAIRVQKEAMEGFTALRGSQHPSTLKATLDLAEMYRALERKDEARQLYERALSGYEARVKEVRDEGKTELGEERRVVMELKGKIREVGGAAGGRR